MSTPLANPNPFILDFINDVAMGNLLTCMENCNLTQGSCAIYGAGSPNAKTTAANTYSINGVLKNKAAIASLSLATMNFWSTVPGMVMNNGVLCQSPAITVDVTAGLTKPAVPLPALANGIYWGCGFFFYLDVNGNVRMTQTTPVSAGNSGLLDVNGNSLVLCPDYNMSLLCPVAVVKVINGSAAVFTPGTTALDSGGGLAVTYADLSTAFPTQPF
jgi:hypothetical protein